MRVQCQGHGGNFTWQAVNVSDLREDEPEDMGKKEKLWFRDEDGRWLFKEARATRLGVLGEDWAECLAHVLAQQLGLPSACVTLATRADRRGVLMKSMVNNDETLTHGNELLAGVVTNYDSGLERANPNYTLDNIRLALKGYTSGMEEGPSSAFDLFTGYLILDALMAGRDRHHQNWAVVRAPGSNGHLAPTYDHGNSFGFTEQEAKIQKRLLPSGEHLLAWAERGRSHHVPGKPTLVGLAVQAHRSLGVVCQGWYRSALRGVSIRELDDALAEFPTGIVSEPRRRLASSIVEVNLRRLLDELT